MPASALSKPTGPIGITVLPVGVQGHGQGQEQQDDSLDNRAVVEVGAEPAPEAGVQGVAVMEEIANFSAVPVPHLVVTLRLDGEELARVFIDRPQHGRVSKKCLSSFAAEEACPKWASGGNSSHVNPG